MQCLAIINYACKNIDVVTLSVVGNRFPPSNPNLAPISTLTSAKLQCEQGALYSYREAQPVLCLSHLPLDICLLLVYQKSNYSAKYQKYSTCEKSQVVVASSRSEVSS